MCSLAASNLLAGKKVLYITLEMAEERISERITANLMDTPINDLIFLSKDTFLAKAERVKRQTDGKLIIKEFPTSSINANHVRFLLNELKIKKNFIPDIIYIDYINLLLSSRYKAGQGANSYTIVKAIAEEIRGLCLEFNLPIVSASQVNRNGFNNSDIEMTDTSESIGLPATVDVLLALFSDEDLENAGLIQFKQLKNRLKDIISYRKFVVGFDRSRMKLYNASQEPSDNEDKPVMDNSKFGEEDNNRARKTFKHNFFGGK